MTHLSLEPHTAVPDHRHTLQEPIPDHTTALRTVLEYLRSSGVSDIDRDVAAVGHRVVHGKHISRAVLVTDDIIRAIEDASDLAPLHNPGAVHASAHFKSADMLGCPTCCDQYRPAKST